MVKKTKKAVAENKGKSLIDDLDLAFVVGIKNGVPVCNVLKGANFAYEVLGVLESIRQAYAAKQLKSTLEEK